MSTNGLPTGPLGGTAFRADRLRVEATRPAAGAARTEVAPERQAPSEYGNRTGSATERPARDADVSETVNRLNELMTTVRRELRFSVDDNSGETVIHVIDAETDEIVRQIPREEVLTLAQSLENHSANLLVDVEA